MPKPAAADAQSAPPSPPAALQRNALGAALGTVSAKPAERSPQSWIDDIRKLLGEGKSEEAGREIAEFKKRYPDYDLPADLR